MEDSSKDQNFAVICSFMNKYGDLLCLPEITFSALQSYLDEKKYGLYFNCIDRYIFTFNIMFFNYFLI